MPKIKGQVWAKVATLVWLSCLAGMSSAQSTITLGEVLKAQAALQLQGDKPQVVEKPLPPPAPPRISLLAMFGTDDRVQVELEQGENRRVVRSGEVFGACMVQRIEGRCVQLRPRQDEDLRVERKSPQRVGAGSEAASVALAAQSACNRICWSAPVPEQARARNAELPSFQRPINSGMPGALIPGMTINGGPGNLSAMTGLITPNGVNVPAIIPKAAP